MLRLPVHAQNPQRRSIAKAVKALGNGDLIIYPTDTVYGIGCNLYNKRALEKLYVLKKKSRFDPISIIVADIRQASLYARISNFAFRLLKHCLPGPYTFILPTTREIPKIMLSKRKEVGIRIPDNIVCHDILADFSFPLVNTSVNMEADELLNNPDEIERRYQNDVALMLDSNWLANAQESTVVRLINDEIIILREGKGNVMKLFE
jgi:tRNA threonylcarbamoyl adenosine modification protein (Sua5/YciO/YrdC/YwlC family)